MQDLGCYLINLIVARSLPSVQGLATSWAAGAGFARGLGRARRGEAWHGLAGLGRHGVARLGAARPGLAGQGTAGRGRHGLARLGLAGSGAAWRGEARHGRLGQAGRGRARRGLAGEEDSSGKPSVA